jgi:hypothetical protein
MWIVKDPLGWPKYMRLQQSGSIKSGRNGGVIVTILL